MDVLLKRLKVTEVSDHPFYPSDSISLNFDTGTIKFLF